MIGLNLQAWPTDALRRAYDTPEGRWYDGSTDAWGDGPDFDIRGMRCLYQFVDLSWTDGAASVGCPTGPDRYDFLVERFGISRVVRAIKQRILVELERRDPTLGEPGTVPTSQPQAVGA